MDDEIIYCWCFNSVECFDSTSFTTIIVLVDILESLLSLQSQHFSPWGDAVPLNQFFS